MFLKLTKNLHEEKVFALPIESVEVSPGIPLLEMEIDNETLDNEETIDILEDELSKQSLSPKPSESSALPEIPKEQKEIETNAKIMKKDQKLVKIYTQQELQNLNYFELKKLPINFTCSLLCPLCPEPKRFKIKSLVQKHIFVVHLKDAPAAKKLTQTDFYTRNLESQCDLCFQRKLYKDRLEYHDHKFVHYNIKPYKCDTCTFSTHSRHALRIHIRSRISRLKHLGCLYCIRNFSSHLKRNQHIRETHPEKLIECALCGQKLIGKKLAKDHFRKHEEEKNLKLECERCIGGIRFPDMRVLELHIKQHEREDKLRKGISCNLCERKFHKENTFKVHLEYHAAGKISACPICGKSETIFTKRTLSKHARDHLRQKSETYQCDKCDLKFRNRVYLVNHYRSVHDRNEQSCYKCGKMVVGYVMKRHLQLCNAGDLPCMHCTMVFKKESERRRHNRDVHVGIRCFRCNKQFDKPCLLLLHQKYDPDHNKNKKKLNRKKT